MIGAFTGGTILDEIRLGHMYDTVGLVNKTTQITALPIISLEEREKNFNFGWLKMMHASCHDYHDWIGLLPQSLAFAV